LLPLFDRILDTAVRLLFFPLARNLRHLLGPLGPNRALHHATRAVYRFPPPGFVWVSQQSFLSNSWSARCFWCHGVTKSLFPTSFFLSILALGKVLRLDLSPSGVSPAARIFESNRAFALFCRARSSPPFFPPSGR